jgi:hypothetical protein
MCIFVLLQKKSVTHLHFVLFLTGAGPNPASIETGPLLHFVPERRIIKKSATGYMILSSHITPTLINTRIIKEHAAESSLN